MNKNLLTVLLFAITFIGFAQAPSINWVTLDQALAMQKKSGKKAKPIFMDVYTEWCGPCKLLDKTTFVDSEVIEKINNNYIAVKFNGEGSEEIVYLGKKLANPNYNPSRKGRNATHQLTDFLELQGYPSLFILDKSGKKEKIIVGYKTAKELLSEI
jgi:thioredoxin-related protein